MDQRLLTLKRATMPAAEAPQSQASAPAPAVREYESQCDDESHVGDHQDGGYDREHHRYARSDPPGGAAPPPRSLPPTQAHGRKLAGLSPLDEVGGHLHRRAGGNLAMGRYEVTVGEYGVFAATMGEAHRVFASRL